MANFKVGQRVKRISDPIGGDVPSAAQTFMPIGAVGTVTEIWGELVRVRPDGGDHRDWGCQPHTLAPLTDPKADEFIERIKNLKPYEEPRVNEKFLTQLEALREAEEQAGETE